MLNEDSDFKVSNRKSNLEEQVEQSSDSDDFVERTQCKKSNKKKQAKVTTCNKYKNLNLKLLSRELFNVRTVIHAKHKVKLSDSARILRIETSSKPKT